MFQRKAGNDRTLPKWQWRLNCRVLLSKRLQSLRFFFNLINMEARTCVILAMMAFKKVLQVGLWFSGSALVLKPL
jgi:hypothetical protein